ncbi:MAG: acetate--CoA ligase family protein [Phycisphaerales bacterium]|nr:MAG: acetate--CoA ligase family protein [Phycisphaerales bacterium]
MPVDFETIESILCQAWEQGRNMLHEHEVYELIHASGAVRVPRAVFRPAGRPFTDDDLDALPGDRVVLKIVSPELPHKSDIGGVRFVPRELGEVNRVREEMAGAARRQRASLTGVVACEYLELGEASLGKELFVGIRASREFGPIIAAGLGGVHTEYMASVMRKDKAIATALTEQTSGEHMFALFQKTMAYDILSGRARGYRRIVADDSLVECFDAFIAVAHRFCDNERKDKPLIADLEVNPFALLDGFMVPLDGLCHLKTAKEEEPPRPISKIDRLLCPGSAAVVGVSTRGMNMGRVILGNMIGCGFDKSRLHVIKPGVDEVDGVRCVESIGALPAKVDLLVVAVAAGQVPDIANQVIESDKADAVIVIPGGMGETAEGKEPEERLRRRIAEIRRSRPDGGPIFLGGNCLGVQSRPGRYDTMFIPPGKLAKRWDAPGRPVAVVSQSGAYLITRISNLETLDPDYAISIGNQIDLTVSDIVRYLTEYTDTAVFGIYVEGFRDLDGLELSRAVAKAVAAGKDVIFYKAGRTEAGRAAAASHTASIAGDYNVCEAALTASGALVAGTFKQFEHLVQLAGLLHGREFSGRRLGGISNAGYEVVGMADATVGHAYRVEFPPLPDADVRNLRAILVRYKLDALVNLQNPLDLTPMAPDDAHDETARLMLDCPTIDAVIASFVPLAPTMKTTPEEISDRSSLAHRLPRIFAETTKPLVVAIDSGPLYDPLAHAIREGGVPVFRSADSAVAALGRYICHKTRHA